MNTTPSPATAGGVLQVLDREIARAGGESFAAGRDLIAVRATVEAMAGALQNLRDAHIAHRGNYPLPQSADYSAMQSADAALAAIGSAAPAGDGEMQCVGIVVEAPNGGLAISTPATPAGGGDLPELPPLPKQIEGYDGDYWTGEQIEEYARAYGQQCRLASTQAAGGGGELPTPAMVFNTLDHSCAFSAGVLIAGESADFYTAEQMREYGERCRLASTHAPAGGGDDLVARLERSLRDLGEHRQAHVVWRDWLLKDPANEQVNPHAGSAKFHDDTIKDYDRHLAAIEEAINRLASTQAAGGGGELPEAEELARDLEALVCVATSGTPRLILSRASALIRRLASAPAPSAWRPIESAPKDGRVVLLVRTGWPAYSGRWHNGDWTDAEDAIRYPEFWMPVPTLPAAPTQEPSHAD